ncbi:MAG TPA: hypothetical protein HPP97_12030 [Desulfuromonadales bacterium]|nr:hypothetical protein [Desulfuromonadales bacterium]
MTESELTAEEREKELTSRLKAMEQQLERLTTHLGGEGKAGHVAGESKAPVRVSTPARDDDYPPDNIAGVSEDLLNWANRTSLLPRLATICFLLVFALVLRTITDSGMIDKLIGSGIGMCYAAILMFAGWYKFRENSPLAPIIAASGALLMSAIVVETHTHFNALPLVPAYLTLIATGIVMALISRQFNAFTPVSVGILGMCFAGAAIDYPHPFFPYLALVLFTANLLGYFASQLKRCTWLRWSALFVTIIMLQLWQAQIVAAVKQNSITPEMAISWFLPVIAVFAITYMSLALFGIVRRGSEKLSIYITSLPTINTLWAFSAASSVLGAQGGNIQLLGIIGILAAMCHFGAAIWLARRKLEGAPGSSAFTLGGGALLALALPAATGSFALSLPVISAVAIFMAIMSRSWGSGHLRLTTYLFHLYSSVALAVVLSGSSPAALDVINILPAGLLAFIILYQYLWCRWCPPTEDYAFFGRFDPHDRSAVMLLLAGLLSGFFMMRSAIYQTMHMINASLPPDAFGCAQSVLVNSAAIVLIVLAYLRHDKEIRNVAIFVTVVGGIKVFAYDLLGSHGLPLVFSVFSFGVAAAIESVVLGKWTTNKPV